MIDGVYLALQHGTARARCPTGRGLTSVLQSAGSPLGQGVKLCGGPQSMYLQMTRAWWPMEVGEGYPTSKLLYGGVEIGHGS